MSGDASFWPRFSLRTVLLSFVATAIGFALLFSAPDVVAVPGLILLIVALPATLTAGVVYGRPRWRAFCIGALFPTGLALYSIGWLFGLLFIDGPGPVEDFSEWIELTELLGFQLRLYAGVSWALAIVLGTLVAFIRHRAELRDD